MKTTDNPRVYVGTYKKYNNVSIQGAWIDLVECKTYQGFLNKCHEVHSDERDPEFMIQDCENMPDGLTSVMEWLTEQEFLDILDAWGEKQPKFYTVDYSEKSFAVIGDTKVIKDQLKSLGGNFNPRLSCGAGWIFPKSKLADVEALLYNDCENKIIPNDKTKQLMPEYLKEIEKAWEGRMLDYFRKKVSSLHRLSNGGILAFEKPSIETSFCFGYSDSAYDTKDYDNANRMAKHASESEDYFLEENLKDFDNKIHELEDESNDYYLYRESYYSEKAPLNVWRYRNLTRWAVKENESICKDLTPCSKEDREIILNGLKQEREKFEKRLKTYLKRYGLSKVKTWSYWRDA